MVIKRKMALIMAIIMMVTMWPASIFGADIDVPDSVALAMDDLEDQEDITDDTELPQVPYYEIVQYADGTQQYVFDAAVELADIPQNTTFPSGGTYGNGYFQLVGTADGKRSNSSTFSLELAKDAGNGLQFTSVGTSVVTIVASSTSGTNTSAISLWDSVDAAQTEVSGISTITGTSQTTLTFEALPAGTYKVVSPASEYNRGVRIMSVVVSVDESTDDSEPTYSVDFTSKAAAQFGANTYVSSWEGLAGKLTGSYNGTPFDLYLIGGNTDSNAGVYRPNGAGRNLTTQNSDGPILVKSPFKIEVDMSTESESAAGIATFIVKSGTDAGTELARVSTPSAVKSENRGVYTLEYNVANEAGQQLYFEVNRGDTGSRACVYSIKIYESTSGPVGTPTIQINSQPADINVRKDRITSNTRFNVTAEAINTSSPALAYQWYSSAEDGTGGIAIPGAIDASYIIPAETGTYYFYCVVSADGGAVTATTRVAKLNVTEGGTPAQWGVIQPVGWTFGFQRASFMADNPQMYLNDALAPIDAADGTITPIMQSGVLLLPYGAATVALGTATTWNATGDTVTVTYGSKTAELTVNSLTMKVGASSVTLPTAPEIFDGVIYLPVTAIAAALENASVSWDALSGVLTVTTGATVNQGTVQHGAMNNQPEQWYGSKESLRLADNLLLFQRASGGWYKNVDFGIQMTEELKAQLLAEKNADDATIDNGATIPEIRYLVKVFQATKIERYRDAYMLGLNAVLGAQYSNGGFPQYIDQRATYHGEITFNDDATAHILRCWLEIINNPSSFFSFDAALFERVENSLIRAIDVILDTQIYSKTQDMLTAWCAQHDRETLVPTWARAYEPPSISGMESVNILKFLMELDQNFIKSLDDGTVLWERVQNSIHSAVAFFAASEIYGLQHTSGTSPWGGNRILVDNPDARGLWGRFIDIETFEPLFVDRNDIDFRTNPDERETYGEIVTGFMQNWKHAPANGGNLRNVYFENGEMDIITSYARLSFERRNGYQFIGDYGLSVPAMYNAWLLKNNLPIPVSEISGVYSSVPVGEVTLNGKVSPANASQKVIVWSVVDAGNTGASITGNVLTTTGTGTITIRASVDCGNFDGTPFTQDFVIEIKSEIPVTNIIGVPTYLPIGTYNFNRMAVVPENAPTKDIVLEVMNDGGTGASVNGSSLTAATAGTVTVRATIANGAADGKDYTQSFDIKIHADPTVNNNQYIPSGALISDWKVSSATLSNGGDWNKSYNKGFGIGSPLYADRANAGTFNVSAVPEFLVGLDWIQTAMDARNGLESSQMTFTVNEDVIVYLAAELRTDMTRIGWVDDTWQFMGVNVFLRNSENQGAYDKFAGVANSGNGKHYLFKKIFKAGETVRLGAINQGTSLGNMMFILDPNVNSEYNPNFTGFIDSPVAEASVSSWINVSGWVLGYKENESGSIKTVDITIDGKLMGTADRVARPDVAAAIKGYKGYDTCGFSQIINLADFQNGTYIMKIRSYNESDKIIGELERVIKVEDGKYAFIGFIDSPENEKTITDSEFEVSGWILCNDSQKKTLIKCVDVFVDDVNVGEAVLSVREDLITAVPGYVDYTNSGFKLKLNGADITPGKHVITITAFDVNDKPLGSLSASINK